MDESSALLNVSVGQHTAAENDSVKQDWTDAPSSSGAAVDGSHEKPEANPRVLQETPSFVRPACDVVLFCENERTMAEIEAFVDSNDYSKMFVETPTALVTVLMNNGYLIGRTYIDGELYSGTNEELSADESIPEDVLVEHRYESTPSGRKSVEEYLPSSLISKLFDEYPEHANAFERVLRLCADGQNTTKESISTVLGSEGLVPHDARTGLPRVLPSYFTDKLERAGALEWKNGWQITEEGREFLGKKK